jgi:hypothetical protein
MKKRLTINESEKNDILGLYLNEQLAGNAMSSIDRLKQRFPNGFNVPTTIAARGANTFANGVDTINPNNQQVNEVVQLITSMLQNTTSGEIKIVVNGGASAVGSASGYDNPALAKRRRDNFINFLNTKFGNNKRVVIQAGQATVGKATVKDSDAAKQEQYVSATISGSSSMNAQVKGVEGDNTNVQRREFPNPIKGDDDDDDWDTDIKYYSRVCVVIPSGLVESYKKKIREFKTENKLPKLKWGETKLNQKK